MSSPDNQQKRPSPNRVAIGIVVGLLAGAAVGLILFDSLALGAGVGMLVGIVFGAIMDARSANRS